MYKNLHFVMLFWYQDAFFFNYFVFMLKKMNKGLFIKHFTTTLGVPRGFKIN